MTSQFFEKLKREISVLQGCIGGAINVLRDLEGEYPRSIAIALDEQSNRVMEVLREGEEKPTLQQQSES